MRILKEHFIYLKSHIDSVLQEYPETIEQYERGLFPLSNKVKDIQKRFCFDCLYSAVDTKYVTETLYEYLDDDHIYTALKQICPKISKNY